MTTPEPLQDTPDFSLVLGGPLFQAFRRAHLSGTALELQRRRVLVITAIAWLPLLLLSAAGGQFLRGQGLPFLRDIEVHVRFLIALPALIMAELTVHRRIQPVMKTFVERGIVTAEDTPRFHAAIEAAMKARNSISWETTLLVFVYTLGHWVWRNELALGTATWYALPEGTSPHLTLPGYWYAFISIPIMQFVILRWYFRVVIWSGLLWRVSRLNLRLLPAHPDGAGGIGFLGRITHAFGPLLFAQGAMLAGIIANRIFYQGDSLLSFKLNIVALVGFFVLVILGPLAVFTPNLLEAKRRGLGEYGALATSYVAHFDEKWLRGGAKDEAILGTGDIQSLADLGNSFAVVRDMRAVPFTLSDVIALVAMTAFPLLPLALTVVPLEELLSRLVKVIF
jgi:hypothetical protein